MPQTDMNLIAEQTRKRIASYIRANDLSPVTIAVVDPSKIVIDITIQDYYPLTHIERRFGIPFGALRSDPARLISDPNELHGLKTSIELHQREFLLDSQIREFKRTGHLGGHVEMALSTGLGNVLQNLRSVAYKNGKLYHIIGEPYAQFPPYPCLVQYDDEHAGGLGVEVLLFTENGGQGCENFDKNDYVDSNVKELRVLQKNFQNRIRWAVSGYPLIINGRKVHCERIAENVSDYRHLWQLPVLKKSVNIHLTDIAKWNRNVEFYFGFNEIRESSTLASAVRGEAVTFPLVLQMTEVMHETFCSLCGITSRSLKEKFRDRYDQKAYKIRLDKQEIVDDFLSAGYSQPKQAKNQLAKPGDFFVGGEEISVMLLPAVYPHHLVGVSDNGTIINISIGGLSGRTGITIDDAQDLCSKIELADALIFDNGNDVVAKLLGGTEIKHQRNNRQARLTAAIHFGFKLGAKDNIVGGASLLSFDHEVKPRRP